MTHAAVTASMFGSILSIVFGLLCRINITPGRLEVRLRSPPPISIFNTFAMYVVPGHPHTVILLFIRDAVAVGRGGCARVLCCGVCVHVVGGEHEAVWVGGEERGGCVEWGVDWECGCVLCAWGGCCCYAG